MSLTMADRLPRLGGAEIYNNKNRSAVYNIIEHGDSYCVMEYQPGNMTMYRLVLVETEERLVISWLWRGGTGGECMAIIKDCHADIGYYANKMRISKGDTQALLELAKKLGYVTKVTD